MTSSLERLGICRVQHNIPNSIFEEGLRATIELIERVPQDILLSTRHDQGIPDLTELGPTRKEGRWKKNKTTGAKEWHDAKWYFHFDELWPTLKRVTEVAATWPEMHRFITANQAIYDAMRPIAEELLQPYMERFPHLRSLFFRGERLPGFVVRHNVYEIQEDGAVAAQAHFDKSFFTINGAESAGGLYGRLHTGEIIELNRVPGESVVMAGLYMETLVGGSARAFPHWVKQKEGVIPLNNKFARGSCVAFVDPIPGATCVPPYQATHALQ